MKKAVSLVLAVIMAFSVCVFSSAAKDPLNYVAVGDSIAFGAGVYNSTEACYAKIVADTNGYNYKNDSVSGFKSAQLLEYLKTNDETIEDISNADILTLSIGGNDFIQEKLPILIFKALAFNDYSMFDDITEVFSGSFEKIIARIKEINPDCTILVQNIYNPRYDYARDVYAYGLGLVNNVFSDYLKENPGAYQIIDVCSAFDGRQDLIANDEVHPSADGNVVIATLILNKLAELGLGTATEPVINVKGYEQKQDFVKYINGEWLRMFFHWLYINLSRILPEVRIFLFVS